MGFWGDNKGEQLVKKLATFKIYTSDLAFKGEILESRFVLMAGINMYDASNMLIDECKKEGFDAIIGAGIAGGTGMYLYGTAVKLKK
ncbi:hypothetical protein [uncultured Eudoraea sp.]|uniref:hypothetical protein n=1 Tax=uncultured Eudoraea sp. TaxID=1035614 RepID=UPI0026371F3C|nr:hypothetical protein [uncultured Eudoraea sp.]